MIYEVTVILWARIKTENGREGPNEEEISIDSTNAI